MYSNSNGINAVIEKGGQSNQKIKDRDRWH